MLLFPDNFITVCFYYMIINIHQGHDAFVPSDDAGVALTKKVNMFPFNRSPYSRKQQYINCEPVTKVKESDLSSVRRTERTRKSLAPGLNGLL